MKKFFCVILTVISILSLSFSAHAEEDSLPLIASGYTEEGIYYEIRGEVSLSLASNSQYVIRQVTYEGKVDPPQQIPWHESINGITYTGTLLLNLHTYKNNKTIALYEGTLTAQ